MSSFDKTINVSKPGSSGLGEPTFLEANPWFLPLIIIIGVIILAVGGFFLVRHLQKREVEKRSDDITKRIRKKAIDDAERLRANYDKMQF